MNASAVFGGVAGAAALVACAEPTAPAPVGACLTNAVAPRVMFQMFFKLPNDAWSDAGGVGRIGGIGQVCVEDDRSWPIDRDVAFYVRVNPSVHELDMPSTAEAVVACGEPIFAGSRPSTELLRFELERSGSRYDCRIAH